MDIKKFQQLFLEGKLEQAREELEVFFSEEISPSEQASALIALGSMHMEIQNTLNREYVEMLDYAINELAKLKKRNHTLADTINLVKARQKLNGK